MVSEPPLPEMVLLTTRSPLAVFQVVAPASVTAALPMVCRLVELLVTLPPLAVMQIKEAVLAGQDASLDAAMAIERKAFQLLFSSADQKEGMRAFLEKRKADFQGR